MPVSRAVGSPWIQPHGDEQDNNFYVISAFVGGAWQSARLGRGALEQEVCGQQGFNTQLTWWPSRGASTNIPTQQVLQAMQWTRS